MITVRHNRAFSVTVMCSFLFSLAWVASADMKPLNNFVTELAATRITGSDPQIIAFDNPREGWLFIALEGDATEGGETAFLDDKKEALLWRVRPVSGAREAMAYACSGSHTLRFENASGRLLRLRAVPELSFCYYPSSNHIPAYGPYAWAYMERHVLSEVNTLVNAAEAAPAEFSQWLREGRRWIANAHLPGLGDREPPEASKVYAEWAANTALAKPGYSGLIVDEFTDASRKHYAAWGEAVTRLYAEPGMAGKTFYAWCTRLYETRHEREFARTLMGLKGRFAWEIYLCEEDTEDAAVRWMQDSVVEDFLRWKEAFPGIEDRMVICLGYLSAPPESLNLDPGVDYHVFLDMQFHLLATDPAFKGLYGLMEYMAAYADEESLQYAHRLFRHYCIEGRTERMNRDPYILPHLKNPDFAAGLEHWHAVPAETDAIQPGSMEKFSWLEGRYPPTEKGNTYCRMKRSDSGPNKVSQDVRALQPGRLYSVKVISANLDALGRNKATTLGIEVSDGEVIPSLSFQCVYPSCYSHETDIYTREHPAYFSFHRLVFRAQAPEAVLTISDRQSEEAPVDAAGTETAFNFVEVQPCHLENDCLR